MSCALSAKRSVHRLSYGMPDFGAAIGTFIDEVDFGHAPVRLDIPHIHGLQSYATGADDGRHLDVVMMMSIGWHIGSPPQHWKRVNLSPDGSLCLDAV